MYIHSRRELVYILIKEKMAKKCKDCPERQEITNVESKQERKFSFPTLWIVVEAKSLDEAYKKVKAMTKYEDKSI